MNCINNNDIIANNSFYLSVANQILKQTELDQTSNNLSNLFSPGYREDHFIIGTKQSKNILNVHFPKILKQFSKIEHGEIEVTNNNLDVALIGDYYFKLIGNDGIKYSVDGRMILNNQSILVNHDGYHYLDNNDNPIEIGNYVTLKIAEDGNIFVNGENIARLSVVGFSSDTKLLKTGGNLYIASEDPINVEQYKLFVGGYRKSNVSNFHAMIHLSNIQREHNMSNNIISDVNKLMNNTITKFAIK